MSQPLPTYAMPPVVEVALSISFRPSHELNGAHFGAFWGLHRDRFPTVTVARPIPEQREEFDLAKQWRPRSLQFEITEEPSIRVQMTDASGEWMRQVQSDRLVVNWRKKDGDYPRYHAAFAELQTAWSEWTSFVRDNNVESLQLGQWEVAYVNRVPKGPLWKSPQDWPDLFVGLWGKGVSPIPDARLRGLVGQWVWDHDERPARLFIEPRPSAEQVMLYLTARGLIECGGDSAEADWESVAAGFDCGHKLIVDAFDHIISESAKKEWVRNG